jgi:hypothetical protein
VPVAWGDRKEEVDEELSPLLPLLWKADVNTWDSCQEYTPGFAAVLFATAADAAGFLEIVAGDGGEDPPVPDGPGADATAAAALYARMLGCGSPADWRYEARPWDIGDVVYEKRDGEHVLQPVTRVDFEVAVCFPRSDLPAVLERVTHFVNDPKELRNLCVVPGDWTDLMEGADGPLAGLLLNLWKASTDEGSEVDLGGQPGIQVRFHNLLYVQMLLDLMARYAAEPDPAAGSDSSVDEAIDERLLGGGRGGDWQYEVRPVNWAEKGEGVGGQTPRRWTGPARFDFNGVVRFPRSDLPAMIERLARVAQGWGR